MTERDVLIEARARIADGSVWWGRGTPAEVGRFCAIQSVDQTIRLKMEILDRGLWKRCVMHLTRQAKLLYGYRFPHSSTIDIVVVNDEIGLDAVLICFDAAIAELTPVEEVVEIPEIPIPIRTPDLVAGD